MIFPPFPPPPQFKPREWRLWPSDEKLRAERDALRAVLQRLVAAKDEKDAHGDTERYRELKAGAWEEARAVLAKNGGAP